MSYILDALKKADAARERESVPGLHSRHDPAPGSAAEDEDTQGLSPKATWALGGVLGGVVLAASMAWWMQPEPMPAAAPLSQAPAAQPPQEPPPQTARVVPLAPPAPSPPLPVAPRVASARPAPVESATIRKPPPEAAAQNRPPPSSLSVDPALRDAPAPVVSIDRLPDDIRRELPALSVGGAMHSDVAANRMLILNGGVFREGDQPAPGVMLEEIKLKSAVFRYKGHRYSVSY